MGNPADRPATEPRTEAAKALDRLDEIAPTLWQQQPKGHPMMPMQIIIREWVGTIRSALLAEAAQGAAPLDSERLVRAFYNTPRKPGMAETEAEHIGRAAVEYSRLSEEESR